jgi:hypothetical protein
VENWQEIVTFICIVITAFAAVYAVQWVKKAKDWTDRTKWWVSLAVAAAFALASSWLAGDVLGLFSGWGDLKAVDLYAYCVSVYLIGKAFYHSYVKPKADSTTVLRT